MSNYPDDIHNYDNDPRSPFCDPDYVCVECEQAYEDIEMANDELCRQCWIDKEEE